MRQRRSLLLWAFLAMLFVTASAEAAEPARVILQTEPAADGSVRVTAAVLDAQGASVPEVPVTFRARTTFGWLILAESTTGRDGRAQTTVPAGNAWEITVEAGEDGTARAAILLGERNMSSPRVRPGRDRLLGLSPQPGLISPHPVPFQVALLGLILAGVWSTYGYVIWLLLRIHRVQAG
jgi:hypothetical protein